MYRSMYVLRDFKGGWPPIPLLAGKREKERRHIFVRRNSRQKNQNGAGKPTPPL